MVSLMPKIIGQAEGFGELEIIGEAKAHSIFISQCFGQKVLLAGVCRADFIGKARFQYGFEAAPQAPLGFQ
jgi:hypothetical protein